MMAWLILFDCWQLIQIKSWSLPAVSRCPPVPEAQNIIYVLVYLLTYVDKKINNYIFVLSKISALNRVCRLAVHKTILNVC